MISYFCRSSLPLALCLGTFCCSAQAQPGPSLSTPWGPRGVSRDSETEKQRLIREFDAEQSDAGALVIFQSTASSTVLTDMDSAFAMGIMLRSGVAESRIALLLSEIATQHAAQYLGGWLSNAIRARAARHFVVDAAFRSDPKSPTELERQLIRSVLLERAALGTEPSPATKRIARWKEWSAQEVNEHGLTWLTASDFRPASAEIFGRSDDQLGGPLLLRVSEQWTSGSVFASHAVECLVARREAAVLPIAVSIRASAQSGGPCANVPCDVLVRHLDWVIWRLSLLSMSQKALEDVVAGTEGSQAHGYALGESKKILAAKELLLRGVSASQVRASAMEFYAKLAGAGAPDADWSRSRTKVASLKTSLSLMGILDKNVDWLESDFIDTDGVTFCR